MVTIVDIVRQGDEHRTTNEPALKALCSKGMVDVAWLAGDSSSLPVVVAEVGIDLIKIPVSRNRSYRWGSSTLLTIKILLSYPFKKNRIVFLSAIPIHYLLIVFTSFFLKYSGHRYFIFMHGELGYLNKPTGLGQRLGALFIRVGFFLSQFSNVTYIALGFPIYKQLSNRFYGLRRHLRCLEIPSTELHHTPQVSRGGKVLTMGAFGVQSQDKGSQKIYELARYLKELQVENLRLVTVGVAAKGFDYGQHEFVQHLCSGFMGVDYIPKDEFVSTVRTLDWALFFYDHDQKYGLIPSGIFYDCINFRMPIVALRSRLFEYYFEHYGPLGVLCDSLQEMADVIKTIVQGEINPAIYLDNLNKAAADTSYTNFKSKLLEIVSG